MGTSSKNRLDTSMLEGVHLLFTIFIINFLSHPHSFTSPHWTNYVLYKIIHTYIGGQMFNRQAMNEMFQIRISVCRCICLQNIMHL